MINKLKTESHLSSEEIVAKLEELTTGLYYQSESDYPVEVVHYNTVLPDPLTEEALVTLTGSTTEMPVEVTDLASFFRHVIKPDYTVSQANSAPPQMVALQIFCEQYLQDINVYQIGRRTLTALLLGRSSEGELLGLKTTIVQT